VRCQIERQDELGQVAEALNEMARKIQEKEKKLVLTIESLKKANEELEAAQTEQLQIEKLASIGRLAAGVAHEVGNPLGAIAGYVDILRRAMKKISESSAEDLDLLDRIENETNRISKIIRALLQQARPTKERIKSVRIKPVVTRSLSLAQIPQHIEVTFEFEDEQAEVMAEEDQLVQVFLNLCINARHAIDARTDRKEAGHLKIRCASRKLPVYRSSNHELGEYDTSMVRALKPETYWVISFEDNGTGISDDDQKKLFEPFFSTKAPGKGTGLGLYVTKSIIESFRGAIVVRSALGFGTSFSVFLPKASRFTDITG
jgi:signal transduction histidine kinase